MVLTCTSNRASGKVIRHQQAGRTWQGFCAAAAPPPRLDPLQRVARLSLSRLSPAADMVYPDAATVEALTCCNGTEANQVLFNCSSPSGLAGACTFDVGAGWMSLALGEG